MAIPEEIMRNRQTWFWRRTTLQATLLVFAVILTMSLIGSGMRTGDWPTAAVQMALIGGMLWLNTMYFAMVDSAAEVKAVLSDTAAVIERLTGQSPSGPVG